MLFRGEPGDLCDNTEGTLLLLLEEGLGFSTLDLAALLFVNVMG